MNGTPNNGVYNPSNLALVSYVHHNPLNFTDPTGRQAEERESELFRGLLRSEVRIGDREVDVEEAYGRPLFEAEAGRLETFFQLDAQVRRFDPSFNFAIGPGWRTLPSENTLRDVRGYLRYLETGGAAGYTNYVRSTRPSAPVQDRTGRPLSSPYYSNWFEMELHGGTFNESDANHFRQANEALNREFEKDPDFAKAMESAFPGISEWVRPNAQGGFASRPFPGLSWHHTPFQPGILQLVPRGQHQAPGPVQRNLHPEGVGGRELWGGGADNR